MTFFEYGGGRVVIPNKNENKLFEEDPIFTCIHLPRLSNIISSVLSIDGAEKKVMTNKNLNHNLNFVPSS